MTSTPRLRPLALVGLSALLLFTALPAGVSSAQVPNNVPQAPSNVFCDQLDPEMCLFPFPNDFFTTPDPSTDTKLRVNFSLDAMPRNGTEITEGGEGKPVDPTEWNRQDGFSPGSMVMTYVPGIDLHKTWGTENRPFSEAGPNEPGYFDYRDTIADPALTLGENAPMVIIDADTGDRHPFWSELDTHPDAVAAGQQALILRPARNFLEGHRYIVAMRNLKDTSGSAIGAGAAFEAYKAGTGADAARQTHYNSDIFPKLEAAGVAKDESLYLAWDFTIASERNLSERILHMRDDAFGRILGDTDLSDRRLGNSSAPEFVVDGITTREDRYSDSRGNQHVQGIRRIDGRIKVPNYLDRPQQSESHVRAGQAPAEPPVPGSRLYDDPADPDTLPDQNPVEQFVDVPFRCEVAISQDGQPLARENHPMLYGHGLLGSRTQVGDLKSPRRAAPFMGCAVDWWGMSASDLPTVVAIIGDVSLFQSLPDRAQQGFLNFMFTGRALIHPDGFASHPAFQLNGQSLINVDDGEGSTLHYDGNSQGGIMGGSLVAVSPDIVRGILGVVGANYSTLLQRSVDWEGAYAVPFYQNYRDPIERQLLFSLMQMLWDRGETNGYLQHLADDPLANTPPHDVMIQNAWSDHQVANVAGEVIARTIDAPIMTPGLPAGEHWEMNPYFTGTATYPYKGSALVYWDSGNVMPPNGNIPPEDNADVPGGNDDPHGHPRDEYAAAWQEAHFLLTGEMEDVCGGGDYLTKHHPANGGVGRSAGRSSCHPPEWAPGNKPEPTPTETATQTPSETPSETEDPTPTETTLTFSGDHAAEGQFSDETVFQATLTETDSQEPVAGAEIVFELTGPDGSRTFTGTTDDSGVARVTPIVTERPEQAYVINARYAGDEDHAGMVTTASYTVAKEDTDTALNSVRKGSKSSLTAVVSDRDSSQGIAGLSVEFFADGRSLGTATTNDRGVATIDLPARYQGGHHEFRARFAGDDYYRESSASRTT